MKYEIELEPEFDDVEDYQKGKDNILDVLVADMNTGKEIKNCYVSFSLSKNGMLGLGKALIRYAQKFRKYSQHQLDPLTTRDIAVERMGVWMTPESATLIIRCEPEFGNVDEEIFSKFDDEKKLKK